MSVARLIRICRQRARSLFRSDEVDAEVARELAFHFDQLVAENLAGGLTPAAARRAARQALGNVAVLEEECRHHRHVSWVHDLRQDLQYGARILRKHRVFTAVAACSLALGLGANTATLGVLHTLTMAPLPFPDGDRLVVLRMFSRSDPGRVSGVGQGDYEDWKTRSRAFEALGLSLGAPGDLSATAGEPAERIDGHLLDEDLVSILGFRAQLGRVFTRDDPRFGTPGSVVVVSHRLWTTRFNADPSIVGRPIRLNRSVATVIGVAPRAFYYPDDRIDFWAPMWPLRPGNRDDSRLYGVVGRLRPGVTVEQAGDELEAMTGGEWGVRARPLRDVFFGWARDPVGTVAVAVALVLLMACANVATLLLARGTVRAPELALRMALGAGRGRVVRQLLAESVLLALVGGALGLIVAWVGVGALRTLAPLPGQPAIPPVAIDARLLGIAVLLAATTAFVFGLVPALRCSVVRLNEPLKGLRRGGTRGNQQVLRSALVAGQIAVAFVLVAGAALLATSVARLTFRDLHFDPDNLITFDIRMPALEFVRPGRTGRGSVYHEITSLPAATLDRVLARVTVLPGVKSAAGISHHPTNTIVLARAPLTILGPHGRTEPGDAGGARPAYFLVTPDFFRTMRTPIVRGREFGPGDTRSSPWVAVVNESFARQLWPGGDAIGKRILLDVSPDEQAREIVGVVRNIPTRRAQIEAEPVVYAPSRQQPSTVRPQWAGMFGRMTFVVRTAGDPSSFVPTVGRAVAEVEPDRPLTNLTSGRVERYLWGRYAYVFVVGAFAIVAILIASAGVYGVMAYAAAHRSREIAIRIALGADARDVIGTVARQGLAIVGAGLVLGLAGAWATTRLISAQLWGISPTDPPTYAAVAVLLSGVAAAACLVPVRRAMRTDPVSVLRAE
jgi:predicted permease